VIRVGELRNQVGRERVRAISTNMFVTNLFATNMFVTVEP